MITFKGEPTTHNIPMNRTDFGRLLIARVHMRKLLTALGQAESEIAHLEHRVKELESENQKLRSK